MKKVLLLFAKISVQKGMTHPADLVRILNDANSHIEAHDAILEDLLFYMDGDTVDVVDTRRGVSVSSYDAVYFRYWGQTQGHAIAVARFCKLKGVPFVDEEVLREGSQNKITQYMNLHEAKVPIPKTLIGGPAQLLGHYVQYGFSFPLILKSIGGTRGKDNYLARDETSMRQILDEDAEKIFVLQSFIPNEGDYRVLVMGGEVVAVIERKASDDSHLNNTSQGGSAQWVPIDTLPAEVRAMSVHAAQFFSRNIAGVDIVRSLDDGTYYCFEVNRAPQIEHASFEHEKAALLAKYLQKL